MPPLTEQAHELVRNVAREGDVVIDATAGNGHDTKFLAELVGDSGLVYAFDLQPTALQRTADLLTGANLNNVQLLQRDHAELKSVLPAKHQGAVAAVMFNLGYLPGGDRSLTTRAASTRAALQAALECLQPRGLLTVIAYTGHPQGREETLAVEDLCKSLTPVEFETLVVSPPSTDRPSPRLFAVRKRNVLSGDFDP